MTDAQLPPGPLSGLRVLELADEKGQFCGKLLGDFGADVVKIEPPGGEPNRHIGPFLDDVPHPERSLSFWYYNTSKRGITLNLEAADGRQLFLRLATTADVVLESYPPGFIASLELDYASLHRQNPQLILCSLTPFGQTGPWRDYHLAAAERQGHPVRVGAVTDQPDAYLTAIANGDGIALVPESASRYYARPGITYRPVTGVSPSQVGVAWAPANDGNPVVQDFVRCCLDSKPPA